MDCAMRAALMVRTPGLGVETLILLGEKIPAAFSFNTFLQRGGSSAPVTA